MTRLRTFARRLEKLEKKKPGQGTQFILFADEKYDPKVHAPRVAYMPWPRDQDLTTEQWLARNGPNARPWRRPTREEWLERHGPDAPWHEGIEVPAEWFEI